MHKPVQRAGKTAVVISQYGRCEIPVCSTLEEFYLQLLTVGPANIDHITHAKPSLPCSKVNQHCYHFPPNIMELNC